jgi:YHS domain-containing protein/thiol-disulfide isomerase/thioredoxin
MRNWQFVFGLMITATAAPAAAQETGWYSSFESARAAADQQGMPVLIHFGAWYCGPCQVMERDVFKAADVHSALRSGIAAVKVDVSQDSDLAGRYGASTVPRDVAVFPDGTVETLNIGRMSRSAYIAMLQGIASRGRKMAVPRPTDPSQDPAGDSSPLIAGAKGTDTTESEKSLGTETVTSEDAPLIGLEGYCPVRLNDRREWTLGQATITSDYRGIRYYFKSEAEKSLFEKNPATYAPQDLGCDPVVLTSDLKAVVGSIRYGAFFDNRLYLFRSTENRDTFKENPLRYTKVRSALKADQIEGTRFQ